MADHSDAMALLSPEMWALISSHLSNDGRKAARQVCRASRDGVSSIVTHVAIPNLPAYPAAGFFRHLPAVKSLVLSCGSIEGDQEALHLASLSLSLIATSQLRGPLPPHRPLLHCLEELHIHCYRFMVTDLQHLASALLVTAGVANLRSLSVYSHGGKPGDDRAVHLIGQALATSSGLSGLQQLGLGLQCPQIVGHIAETLTSLHNLKELDLSGNRIDEAGGAQLAGVLSNTARPLAQLQTLDLQDSRLGEQGTSTVARALAAATHMTRLQKLSFRDTGMDVRCAGHLAEMLRSAQHLAGLTCLDFSHNDMGAEGTRTVAQALQAATHIRSLRELRFGDHGKYAVANALLAATHLSSLRQLVFISFTPFELAGVLRLSEALRSGTPLRELQELVIAGSFPAKWEVVHLAETLQQATHLSSLTSLHLKFDAQPGVPDASSEHAGAYALLLAMALRNATHLVNLRNVYLNDCGVAAAYVDSFLTAAPHLAGVQFQLEGPLPQ